MPQNSSQKICSHKQSSEFQEWRDMTEELKFRLSFDQRLVEPWHSSYKNTILGAHPLIYCSSYQIIFSSEMINQNADTYNNSISLQVSFVVFVRRGASRKRPSQCSPSIWSQVDLQCRWEKVPLWEKYLWIKLAKKPSTETRKLREAQ